MQGSPDGQIDRVDRGIMKMLAADARTSVSRIAERVGLSQSACTRRIQAIESTGRISGYGVRFGLRRMGFRVTALVDITLNTQVEEELAQFERAVAGIIGVVECNLVSGANDYRLKIICRDLDDYERIHREHLGKLPAVSTINSSFVLRSIPTRSEADAMLA
ncbi:MULTISPECIES: Lrp/AsnC family transcriptional regulator [Sphingomonadales]|uniref:Leucine-responsive regulatory protein n=1 Tax=Edaphosphingomonas haloaromaticamans TaxID=653954 RepID=A0A1S1HDJ0_9SPHN|nr:MULTISPECIES: Lrp/AsnC family transcriptional regulator [Sphingomonas]MDX3882846.1 Lrp/AsnC family transcriptional regulator [Sphingomonas sp.]OHT20299.1 Leucine-responsive regulatory protein [Sphingomonas haloaromaticamans]